jgi:dolichol kinase
LVLKLNEVLFLTGLLLLWNLLVIHIISKKFYNFFKDKDVPAEYIGRKIVHIFGGGVTAFLIPDFYEGYYWLVTASAFLLALYLYFRRKWKRMYWFQVDYNAYEVNFAFAYGIVILIGSMLGNIWVGVIPVLFMSLGDAITGMVRAFTQKKHVKSWDGTIAMFLVCTPIAIWKLSLWGIPLAVIASLVERIPRIDDNITVPIVAMIYTYLLIG